MLAVVLRKTDQLALLDVPVPTIAPDQALVRMTHCGICGSDIRYLRGENPWAKQTLGEIHTSPGNMILGHEVTGVVEQVGDECDPCLIGRRVALLAFGTCGECFFCRRGEEHLCPNTQHLGHGAGWGESEYYYGGMAEYVPVYGKWLVPLPDSVSNEAGAVLDPLGVAVHGLRAGRMHEGDTVLVIGCGPVGALAVQVAKAAGAASVVAVDPSEGAARIARESGADYALDPGTDSVASAIAEASSGMGARVVLDTIGAELNLYLPLLARGGRYITMTVTDDHQDFRTILLAGERSVASSCNFQYPDYYEALSLLESGVVDGTAIITHRFPLAGALEAFRVAEEKSSTGAVKVVLTNP